MPRLGFEEGQGNSSRSASCATTPRGARVVVPPSRKAVSPRSREPRSPARDRAIARIRKVGRRRREKEFGYHQQGRVENTFFRYKSIIGGRLRARQADA